jgi:hypothetical protein
MAIGLALLAPAEPAAPPRYVVAHTSADRGRLLSAAEGPWTGVGRVEWGPPEYVTAFRALWDDAGLFLRFDAKDAVPWHTFTRRDEQLWEEEVVEVFLDPARSGRDYAELEISPANVVCDVRMERPWPDKKMDLAWDLEGLETRVEIRQDAEGRTSGWTALAFLPWEGLRSLPSSRRIALPPRAGDRWRFNVFRIERPGGRADKERGAVFAAWSSSSQPGFHVPDAFRDLVFEGRR